MFSSVFELPTKVLGLLPETGFYTCVLSGTHLDFTYSEKESPVNPILIQHSLKNNQGSVFSFFDQRANINGGSKSEKVVQRAQPNGCEAFDIHPG